MHMIFSVSTNSVIVNVIGVIIISMQKIVITITVPKMNIQMDGVGQWTMPVWFMYVTCLGVMLPNPNPNLSGNALRVKNCCVCSVEKFVDIVL